MTPFKMMECHCYDDDVVWKESIEIIQSQISVNYIINCLLYVHMSSSIATVKEGM